MATYPAHHAALEAEPKVFWLDREDAPQPSPPLTGDGEADLLVVGAGLTGPRADDVEYLGAFGADLKVPSVGLRPPP